jgi:RNAse (barnase) inhibitor barstar
MPQSSGAAMDADYHAIFAQTESFGDIRVVNLRDSLHFQVMVASPFPIYISFINLHNSANMYMILLNFISAIHGELHAK